MGVRLFLLSRHVILGCLQEMAKPVNAFSSDGTFQVDAIWDCNAPKYRVACQSVHVTKAAKFIGYSQVFIIALFAISVVSLYSQPHPKVEELEYRDEVNVYLTPRYISGLLTALSLQLSLVVLMLHGVRTGRRSFLLPFIAFASVALFLAIFQVSMDALALMSNDGSRDNLAQVVAHFIGIFVHVWCMAVICKCYSFFGDKHVAESIGQQLQSTSIAFAIDFSRPPPYSRFYAEKQPLNSA
ncbi:unnamed protein product [Caenorhabditis auriculariae]|uniref:Uncharacterized protein n=1 Tax=Caenorhabditis auriculariae TaxID=2777116 RepID=A0A8S1GNN8_9PELO|nr:unnamed protein product [Caenorhabditis auriculariae]